MATVAKQEDNRLEAVGLIETQGLSALLAACDAMVKAARVTLIGYTKTGNGHVAAVIRGDVAACNAAISAGAGVARDGGKLILAHVIPRPHPALSSIFPLDLS